MSWSNIDYELLFGVVVVVVVAVVVVGVVDVVG